MASIPKPKEIYRWEKAKLNDCEDKRPCIILDPPNGNNITIMAISSQLDLMPLDAFLIEGDSRDFQLTGLPRTSYIDVEIHEISISELGKKLGELRGDLADRFDKWI